MNWWQYNPYNPTPPWWGGGQQQNIPCPPGVDPIKVMEFMDRVQRRAQKAKEKEKKPSEEKKHWKEFLWYFQAACILYFLSPPIAALQHLIATITESMLK